MPPRLRSSSRRRLLAQGLLGPLLCAAGPAWASTSAAASYQQPSAAIRELLDDPVLPRLLPSPDRKTLAQLELRRYIGLEELARPMQRLAGLRFEASNASTPVMAGIQKLRLRPLLQPDAPERVVDLPAGGVFHSFSWAPDGQRFVLERRQEHATELWVGDTATGRLRFLPFVRLNNVLGQGEMAWLNPKELVVLAVPDRRGPPPLPPRLPSGPIVQENYGQHSPERTHADLLRNPHDEALFEYHARSVLTLVNLESGLSRPIGEPGLFQSVDTVGEGQALLTERVVRPFSYQLSWDDFPSVVELRQRDGKLIRELARLGLKQNIAIDGVPPGPRQFYASPTKDASVYWVEALDGGNPANKVTYRDRIMRLKPPYTGEAAEVQRMPHRFARLQFLDDGLHALLTEVDRNRAWTRTHLLPLRGTQSRLLFEHALRERYRHPGSALTRMLPNGRRVVQTQDHHLFMAGPGASPKGERPFLDRWSLRDSSAQRIFQSSETLHEQVLAWLGPQRLLLQRESQTEPPNLWLREGQQLQALTRTRDPAPTLHRVRREFVQFKRADGVEMSFWLMLPPDYKDGEQRPALVWAYPLEYTDSALASQAGSASNRFLTLGVNSPLHLLMDGFIVLHDATMPIVGDSKTLNDSFVEQLSMNARAIVDKAEDLGMIDTKRLAIGGHSYGAFMAANLLAHTSMFKAGIARSGAYNRTLTPFGFQSERRSLWEARDFYLKVSPFLYAPQIKEPLLLIHGEADTNSGTFPVQSERMFQALAGTGGKVRYVQLPHEGHGYAARESAGHVIWEMSQWLRTHLGDPRGL